jgi:hypothetical protein
VSSDRLRLLHGRSEHGYTSSVAEALPAEPEAIDRETQQCQTRARRRAWELEQRRAWGTARQQIDLAVETFRREAKPRGQVLDDLRGIERQLGRVDRHLRA